MPDSYLCIDDQSCTFLDHYLNDYSVARFSSAEGARVIPRSEETTAYNNYLNSL